MNQAKKYTVVYATESEPSYNGSFNAYGMIQYANGAWTAKGIGIESQTANSVSFDYSTGGLAWYYGAVLEGSTFAEKIDFTEAYPQTKDFAYRLCFIEGTLITLVDGTKKPVEDISYDDDILCWDFYKGKLTSAKPVWITTPHIADCYNLCKFSNGAEVGFVGMGGTDGYHRIYNDEAKAFTHTGVAETPIGTHTFAEDGTFPKLVNQQIVHKQVKFYNVGTEKHFNLFTNGILTSSRISNCYKIENMKYYGEQLISDEEIAKYIDDKRNY